METRPINLTMGILVLIFTSFLYPLHAQECIIQTTQDQGYSTSISNVIDNGNGSYTITLIVENDGCNGCKKLNTYAVEAEPGTYSDVTVDVLSGNFTYANIDLGPDLGNNIPFQGFRINNANGMGNGNPASFALTYTLTGALQDQQTYIKAASYQIITSFSAADFQSVYDCLQGAPAILPYYDPLGVGKIDDIIGYALTSLHVSNQDPVFDPSTVSDVYRIVGESVLINLVTQPGQYDTALSELTAPAYGLTIPIGDAGNNKIQGLYPINNLLLLNDRADILVSARPSIPGRTNAGLITSQGDTAMRSFIARDVFKVDGTGIKVGVISDSYNTKLGDQATDDVIKGDLPGLENPDNSTPVDVLFEYPYGEASDEGRAMAQIVHDIAPGATLAFRTGFAGALDFAAGINALEQAGCDIIVDDVTYITEPFFRDGVVAQAADYVTSLGVSYFSAAGNFGTNSWESNFNSAPSPSGLDGESHNFAPAGDPVDISQSIKLYQGQYTVVLQWDDGTPGLTTQSDFDIYLANDENIALFGLNSANIGGEPIEVLPFTVLADSVESNFQIIRSATASGYDSSQPTLLKYIVYRGTLVINEYGNLNASTITGQANAEGAMAVGAVLYENTPEYGEPAPTVASFSSRGSTPVNGIFRSKPDFCAPNVVNTSVALGGGFDYEGDGFPNFIGTSAAAPHAAGVAALLKHARQKYYTDPSLSPTDVKAILKNTALDMYEPGYDVASGAGFILADSALNNLANPTAFLITVTYDTTLVPGFDEIPITITGEYLDENSEVYFNGEPLETSSELQGDTAITATIPVYDPSEITFPEIQVNNQPQEGTNGLDGGLSNVVYLTTKSTILIDIQDVEKTYGESLPEFTANYFLSTLEGNEPLSAAGLTPDDLARIQSIDFATIANSLSNIGLWGIEPDANDPLNPLSGIAASEPLDISLLERYNFVFGNGLMTINPLDIVIDPKDTTVVYNEELVGFDFEYLFNGDNTLNITAEDSSAIANAVRLVHGTALVNRPAALVQGTALVNEFGEPLLTEENLQNTSVMVSNAVRLVQGTALVNGSLLDPEAFYEAAALTNVSARLVQGTALVNALRLVQGTALVNEFDDSGAIINAYPLTQGTALVNNSGGELSTSTFNADSNSETIVILGEGDLQILSGEAEGSVELESNHLVTGDNVGTHFIVPGAFISNNFNISYLLGSLNVTPDTAEFEFDAESLIQVYDGNTKEVIVVADPDTVNYTVTYNGSEELPVNAGSYSVEVNVTDDNYFGSATATLIISPSPAVVTINEASETQVYNGEAKSVTVSTVPEGIAVQVLYDDSEALPTEAGTYEVSAAVTDLNYIGSANGTLTIEPATATIEISNLSQVYNGDGKFAAVTTTPGGLSTVVTYNGLTDLPVNVGSYNVLATINENNYVGSANATLEITPATADISFSDLMQVYDGNGKSVSATTSPQGLNLDITYDGSTVLPVDAGSYEVIAIINELNYVGSSTTTLVINPATAAISLSGLNQIYNGSGISPSVSTLPNGLNVVVTYNGLNTPPVNAGNYTVEVTVDETNYIGSATGALIIAPATATASAEGTYFTDEGGELPEFSVTYSGFVGTDDASVVSSVTFNLSPEYSGNAGTYEVIPVPVAANYTFNTINGTFYVNPSGPGTKQIKPIFICAEALSVPDENGYTHLAYLAYENKNQDNVYVPIGPDNEVTGSASVDTSEQPELFLAGGGTLEMPFDGGSFTWQVTSNKKNGSKGAIPANSSNANCGNKAMGVENTALKSEITLYPNPTSGQVFVQISHMVKEEVSLEIYDSTGRQYAIDIQKGKGVYEMNLSGFTTGLYLLKITLGKQVEVRRLIVQ